jgi:biotin-(acetyl-CoA carboxylase) ligase
MKTSRSFPFKQISRSLTTRWLGKTIHFFPEVDSTNVTAKDLAQQKAVEGMVVLTEQNSRVVVVEGIAVDVTEEGALLVRVEQDSLITVDAGDVGHLRIVKNDEDR